MARCGSGQSDAAKKPHLRTGSKHYQNVDTLLFHLLGFSYSAAPLFLQSAWCNDIEARRPRRSMCPDHADAFLWRHRQLYVLWTMVLSMIFTLGTFIDCPRQGKVASEMGGGDGKSIRGACRSFDFSLQTRVEDQHSLMTSLHYHHEIANSIVKILHHAAERTMCYIADTAVIYPDVFLRKRRRKPNEQHRFVDRAKAYKLRSERSRTSILHLQAP